MITSFFSPPFTGRAAPQFVSPHKPEEITSPPAKVSIVSPANGAVNQQLDIYLSWAKPPMARRYDVYFGATSETIALVCLILRSMYWASHYGSRKRNRTYI